MYKELDITLRLFGIRKTAIFLIVLLLLVLFWICTFALSTFAILRIIFNTTTNECINADKYTYISLSGKYYNRNDRGIWKNFYNFFICDDTPQPAPNPSEELKEKKLQKDFFETMNQQRRTRTKQ